MIPDTDVDLFQVVEEVDYQTHLLGSASSNAINTRPTLEIATADSFQRMRVKSVHVAEGLGHRRDTYMVLAQCCYEQWLRDESIRSRMRAGTEVSLGTGSRRDDDFDKVLLSIRLGETGAIRTNSGEERWLENRCDQNNGAELSLYSDSTAVWLLNESGSRL